MKLTPLVLFVAIQNVDDDEEVIIGEGAMLFELSVINNLQLSLSLWSGSKRVVNFSWYSLQRSRENYFRNFGVSLRETNRQKKNLSSKNSVLDLECRILSQEPSDSCICILMS